MRTYLGTTIVFRKAGGIKKKSTKIVFNNQFSFLKSFFNNRFALHKIFSLKKRFYSTNCFPITNFRSINCFSEQGEHNCSHKVVYASEGRNSAFQHPLSLLLHAPHCARRIARSSNSHLRVTGKSPFSSKKGFGASIEIGGGGYVWFLGC